MKLIKLNFHVLARARARASVSREFHLQLDREKGNREEERSLKTARGN